MHACTASPLPASPCDATNGGYDETEQYDTLGNLTSKGGVAAVYPGTGLAHPHAPSTVGSAAYTYDANGNTRSGGGKTITWEGRNLPSTITVTTPPPPPSGTPSLTAPSRGPAGSGSPSLTAPSRGGPFLPGTPNLTAPSRGNGTQATTTESYTYDADGQRVTRTANGITTVYIGGLFEQDVQSGVLRSQYAFAGRVIAQRTQQGASTTLVYLHGDHLGSVSVATSSTGAVLDRQEYGPWGNIRSGGVSETTLNYTGQKRDGTGLVYYGARYYDPALGRFLSPDSIGVDFTNPQTLNRYAYVGNNPVNRTDPTGHCASDDCGGFDNGDDHRDWGKDRAPEQDYERQRESEAADGHGDADNERDDGARDIHTFESSGTPFSFIADCMSDSACRALAGASGLCLAACKSGYDAWKQFQDFLSNVSANNYFSGNSPFSSTNQSANAGNSGATGKTRSPNDPIAPYPGSALPPDNPANPPGPGWDWRGAPTSTKGDDLGAWFNPDTGESLHPDFNHGPPTGPHWDYGNKKTKESGWIDSNGDYHPDP